MNFETTKTKIFVTLTIFKWFSNDLCLLICEKNYLNLTKTEGNYIIWQFVGELKPEETGLTIGDIEMMH